MTDFHRHLYGCPWAIVPEKHRELCEQIKAFDTLVQDGDDEMTPGLLVFDGIAYIHVCGTMVPECNSIESELFGLCSTRDVIDKVAQAQMSPDVEGILIIWDTPGGYTSGVPELARAVAESKKPLVNFVEGGMDSAGYWAGCSQTTYADEMASVGSIGCYMAIYDYSKMFEMQGLKTVLISTGANKGAGTPGTKLTEEQVQHYADEVVGVVGAKFFEHVRTYRDIDESLMDGRSWLGERALEFGLIDAVGSREDALNELINLITQEVS